LIKKDIVIGLGEIGFPIFKLLSKKIKVDGFDKIEKLNTNNFSNIKNIEFMHICIPFSKNFEKSVLQLTKKFNPDGIVIHSTISPNTTKKLQAKIHLPIIYSATRGVHKRMLKDLKRYTKFFAVYDYAPKSKWASQIFKNKLKKCDVKTKQMSQPITLELAKVVCDTSYYGWLINFAQISKMIADKENVDYDEMWSFTDEIQKFLKNRPKMFPGFIGGHCVIPNLDLMDDKSLNQISSINNIFKKFLDTKSI
tara:strand:- start:1534 stop:2289 length:756 start_codon:yes stop_codon:yes gene_type:complete